MRRFASTQRLNKLKILQSLNTCHRQTLHTAISRSLSPISLPFFLFRSHPPSSPSPSPPPPPPRPSLSDRQTDRRQTDRQAGWQTDRRRDGLTWVQDVPAQLPHPLQICFKRRRTDQGCSFSILGKAPAGLWVRIPGRAVRLLSKHKYS